MVHGAIGAAEKIARLGIGTERLITETRPHRNLGAAPFQGNGVDHAFQRFGAGQPGVAIGARQQDREFVATESCNMIAIADVALQYTFDEVSGSTVYDGAYTASGGARVASSVTNGTLQGNATTVDSGSGGPIFVPGIDTALAFGGSTGSGGSVETALVGPTGSDARTIMLWAKTASDGAQTFVSYGTNAALGRFAFGLNLWEGAGGGKGVTLDTGDGAVTFQPLTPVNDGQWHHYAVVVPSAGTLTDIAIYQDGRLLTTRSALFNDTNQTLNTQSGTVTLGEEINNDIGFNGQMAEVSVWSRALTTAEVNQAITQALTGGETGLEGYWRLNDGSGTNVADYSDNGNDGTIDTTGGTVTWVDNGVDLQGNAIQTAVGRAVSGTMTADAVTGTPAYSALAQPQHGTLVIDEMTGAWTYDPTDDYQGIDTFTLRAVGSTGGSDEESITVNVGSRPTLPENSALNLDGNDDYVDVGTLEGLSGAMTIEAWVKFDSYSGAHAWTRVVDFGQGQDDDNILIGADGITGKLAFHIRQGAVVEGFTSEAVLPLGEWVHVAASTDGTTGSLYINGVKQPLDYNGSGADLGGALSAPIHSALNVARDSSFIGNSNWTAESSTDGQIDEVRVWNVQRTDAEIAANYDRTLNGDEEGLYAYWSFDEAAGVVVHDQSGNGRDGTILGGTEFVNMKTVEVGQSELYKGMILGADADGDELAYALADGGGPSHGTFAFDTDSNTYEYQNDGTAGEDSVTIQIDDGQQTTQQTIHFNVT